MGRARSAARTSFTRETPGVSLVRLGWARRPGMRLLGRSPGPNRLAFTAPQARPVDSRCKFHQLREKNSSSFSREVSVRTCPHTRVPTHTRKRLRAGTASTRARHKARVRLHAPLHVLARELARVPCKLVLPRGRARARAREAYMYAHEHAHECRAVPYSSPPAEKFTKQIGRGGEGRGGNRPDCVVPQPLRDLVF